MVKPIRGVGNAGQLPPLDGADSARVLVTDARALRQHLVEKRRVEVSIKQVVEALSAFERGQRYVLEKYPGVTAPPLYVVFSGNPRMVDDTPPYLALPLERIVTYSETGRLERAYDSTVPVKTHLTLRQDLEGVGLEETLHYAQKLKTPGLVELPPADVSLVDPYASGFLAYLLQPWEFEAVVARGEFYQATYGVNPLKDLEAFLRRAQQEW